MSGNEQTGHVQTVLGLISPGELGVTLTHEHLLIDLTMPNREPKEASAKALYRRPVSQETLGYIRHYNAPNRDNFTLLDVDTAIEEAMLYKRHGGETLVDATSIGIARDPDALARISRATGLHIIMGSSYYVAEAHPDEMDGRSEEDIVDEIVRDVTQGVGATGVKAGVIGEVGCSWPLTDNERKVLRASGRAQRITGAPLLIHPGRDDSAPLEILEVLAEVGTDLGRTIMGHIERTAIQQSTLMRVAKSGCYVEWDLFGKEASYYTHNPKIDMPSDAKRIADIAWLSSQGFGDKIVIAHDICSKDRLLKYGGHGYFYILSNIVPRMRSRGFSDEAIHNILVDNPTAALTFAAPGPP